MNKSTFRVSACWARSRLQAECHLLASSTWNVCSRLTRKLSLLLFLLLHEYRLYCKLLLFWLMNFSLLLSLMWLPFMLMFVFLLLLFFLILLLLILLILLIFFLLFKLLLLTSLRVRLLILSSHFNISFIAYLALYNLVKWPAKKWR